LQIDELEVSCPAPSCTWIGTLSSESFHLRECDRVLVSCVNEKYGCTFKCQRLFVLIFSSLAFNKILFCLSCRLLGDHQSRCEFAEVLCPHEGCGEFKGKNHLQSHLKSCVYRPVSCPKGCSSNLQFHQINDHLSTVCPNELVPCPNRTRSSECSTECVELYRRVDLLNHQNTVGYLRCALNRLVTHFYFLIPVS
jgi:hypothetical protein